MNLPRNIFLAALLTILCDRTHSLERSLDLATYQFRTCGKSGQNGPTRAECEQYYVGSALSGKLAEPQLEGGLTTAGVQYFEVPVADWYVLTVSGGRGGRGVCTRWAGRSPVIQNRVYLEAGAVLEVSVGHRGVDACDNNPLNVSLCHLSINTIEEAVSCSSRWQNISSNSNKDGSGGGGGGSLVRFLSNQTIAVLVGGGAGESAQFPNISEALNDTRERVKDVSLSFTTASSGARPVSAGLLTAGRGGGYRVDILNPSIVVDGKDFLSQTFAVGGSDCFTATGSDPSSTEFFPGTCGGFGGGGGGCANGPGGGGYGGGSARDSDVAREGSGGMSFIPVGYQQLGWNDGDGFVDLRRENCGCTGDCVVNSSRSVFECMCPDNTTLSADGFDCQTEADLVLISNNSVSSQEIRVDDSVMLVLESWELQSSQSVGLLSLSLDFQSSLGLPSMPEHCGVVLADSEGRIVGVVRYQSAMPVLSSVQRVVQDNYTFSIGPPSTLLDRSLDFASAHLFKAKGDDCGIESNISANISILEGKSLGSSLSTPSNVSFQFFFQALLIANVTTSPTQTATNPSLTPFPDWVYAAILGGAIALVLTLIICLILICICCFRCRRSSKKVIVQNVQFQDNSIYSIGLTAHQGVVRTNPASKPLSDNNYSTVKAFRRKSKLITMSMPVDDMSKSLSMPRPYADLTVPNYGVEVPQGVDFSQYNQTRTEKDDTAWHVPRDTLTYMRELGEGEFGKVLLMSAKNIAGYLGNIPVAVKTLSKSRMKDIDKFMQEVNIMKKFTHPNIVCLLGVCPAAEDAAPMMILELMPYGDLQAFLEANRPEAGSASRITAVEFFQFALDIANALEFLALNLYVHRDVAARNCLVGNELVVKLADFGMARGVKDKDLYRIAGKAKLPVKWMAPESLIYGEFTPASDVWSYGVLLWEICSYGDSPLHEYGVQDVVQLAENRQLAESHTRPHDCPNELFILMRKCLSHESVERPCATDICSTLDLYSNEDYRLEEVDTICTQNDGVNNNYVCIRNTIIENSEGEAEESNETDQASPLSPAFPHSLMDNSIHNSQVSLV